MLKKTVFDCGIHVMRIALAFLWKFGVATLALAIILGMIEGTDSDLKRPTADVSGRVQLVPPNPDESQNTNYQLVTRIPDNNSLVCIKLIDTLGNHHMTVVYSDKGLLYSFMSEESGARFGYSKQPDGVRAFHISSPTIHCKFSLNRSGETAIDLTEPNGTRKSFGSTRVAPDGKLLSSARVRE